MLTSAKMHEQTPFAAAKRKPLSKIHCSSAFLGFLTSLFTISQALVKNTQKHGESAEVRLAYGQRTGPTLCRHSSFNARKQLATVNSCPKVEIVALKLHGSDSLKYLNLGCPSQSRSILINHSQSKHAHACTTQYHASSAVLQQLQANASMGCLAGVESWV